MAPIAPGSPPVPSHDDLQMLLRAAVANAKDLLNDAQLLADAGSFPRALALATLSWEELSKADLCAMTIVLPIPPDYFWKNFRNHEGKLSQVHAFADFLRPEPIGSLEEHFKRAKGLSKSTQDLKERGLYVDYRRGKMLLPSQIGERAARKQIKVVREALAIADEAFYGDSIEAIFSQLNVPAIAKAWVAQPDAMAAALQEAMLSGSHEKVQSLVRKHETVIDDGGG